jgi:AcrR family transcriptional regulator
MAQKTIRLPRAERRRQILTVAAAAFAEGGFGSVTMEEIAGRVGVTRLILYRAFAAPAAPSGAALRAYIIAARQDAAAFMLLFMGAAESPIGAEIETARSQVRAEIVQQALAQAAKEGITPDPFWSPLVAELTLAIVERGAQWWLDRAPQPAADDAFVEYVQRGVGGMLNGIAAGHFNLRFPGGRARA